MSKWLTERLADLCELIADCPHSTPKWTESGALVLRSQNIRGGRLDLSKQSFTDEAHFEQRSRRARLKAGDLVITREAPMGEVCIIPDGLRCCLGQRMVMLRPDTRKCDSRFLLYAIQSPAVQHEIKISEGTGSTVSNLRIPLLEALAIPHPPLAEQKVIAHILGTLDDKIELNRRMNETLEAMARAIFQSWFVDFDPVRAKASGESPDSICQRLGLTPELLALFPDSFEDSELGEIPKGWLLTRLDDVLELAYGKALKATDRIDGEIPVYGSGGVTGYHNESLIDGSAIIVGRKGTVGSLYWEDRSSYPIDTVFYVKPKLELTYCFYLLQTLALDTMNTDAAVPGLNRNNVYRLLTSLPDEKLRAAFDDVAMSVRRQMRANTEELQTLSEVRDALLPKLLSGELMVQGGDFK